MKVVLNSLEKYVEGDERGVEIVRSFRFPACWMTPD